MEILIIHTIVYQQYQLNSTLFTNHITFDNGYMKCDKLRKSIAINFSFGIHLPHSETPWLTLGIITELAEERPRPAVS